MNERLHEFRSMAESMDRMSGLFRDTREPLPIHTLRNSHVHLLIWGEKNRYTFYTLSSSKSRVFKVKKSFLKQIKMTFVTERAFFP